MYVSEENRFEELLANHFNNSRGWREVLCCGALITMLSLLMQLPSHAGPHLQNSRHSLS